MATGRSTVANGGAGGARAQLAPEGLAPEATAIASTGEPTAAMPDPRAGRYRWVVVALLFAATAINYVDRQMIGVLKPTLEAQFHWSEEDFATIVFWFQVAYAVGYLSFGRVVDALGARLGYAAALVIWTVAHMAHGLAGGVTSFALARFGLGIGESGNFPAGIRAVSDWFPRRERALAIGIFNAGANVGAIVTPLIVPLLIVWFDWRVAFYVTGILGVLWLVAWWALYRDPEQHPKISAGELAWIRQDGESHDAQGQDVQDKSAGGGAALSWGRLFTTRETWAYALGKLLIDPVWWFFLFWLPGYMFQRYNLDLKSFGLPLAAIYLISDLGSVAGGWLSSRLLRAGLSLNAARKLTMLASAVCVLPIWYAQSIASLWAAVGVIGLATAAHQAFSANLYTLPSDVFPRGAVGQVVGIGGTLGALGGMGMALLTGYVLESTHSYALLFALCASTYFVALALVHLLSPRMAPARV